MQNLESKIQLQPAVKDEILIRHSQEIKYRLLEGESLNPEEHVHDCDRLQATAAGILRMDHVFGTDTIIQHLNKAIFGITRNITTETDEEEKNEMLEQVKLLLHLLNEWHWIAAYGPRYKYMP